MIIRNDENVPRVFKQYLIEAEKAIELAEMFIRGVENRSHPEDIRESATKAAKICIDKARLEIEKAKLLKGE